MYLWHFVTSASLLFPAKYHSSTDVQSFFQFSASTRVMNIYPRRTRLKPIVTI